MANTYYVASDGSGDFTTIAQVNGASLVSGDSVLFRRGDTFNDAKLSCVGGVTYEDYGIGNKPLFNATSYTENLYINKLSDVTINNLNFSGGQSSGRFIYVWCGQNINITNCDFSGSDPDLAIYMYMNTATSNRSGISISGCTFDTIGVNSAIQIYITGILVEDIEITNCTFTDIIKDAIYIFPQKATVASSLSPQNISITDNTLTNIGRYAIHLSSGRNVTVSGNTLNEIGSIATPAVDAIQLNNIIDGIVEENSVTNVYTSDPDGVGIILDFGFSDNDYLSDSVICRKNFVSGCNTASSHGISAYKCTNCLIYDNIVVNSNNGLCIMNSQSVGNVFYNNTVYGVTNNCFTSKLSATSSIVKNNIFYNGDYGIRVEGGSTNPVEDYNCFYSNGTYNFYNNTTGEVSIGSNSITSDPLFISASDYHLQSTSPCKDAGEILAEVTDDYEGNLRPMGASTDIGAYEWYKCKIMNATLKGCTI